MLKLQGDFHFSFGTSTKRSEQPQGDFFALIALQREPCTILMTQNDETLKIQSLKQSNEVKCFTCYYMDDLKNWHIMIKFCLKLNPWLISISIIWTFSLWFQHVILSTNWFWCFRLEGLLDSLWSSSYGSWIYNYLCNQCLLPLTLRVRILLKRGVLDTILCDKVCQWLAAGLWFSPGTPVSSTNKTACHDSYKILLKVALNTMNTNSNTITWIQVWIWIMVHYGKVFLIILIWYDTLKFNREKLP